MLPERLGCPFPRVAVAYHGPKTIVLERLRNLSDNLRQVNRLLSTLRPTSHDVLHYTISLDVNDRQREGIRPSTAWIDGGRVAHVAHGWELPPARDDFSRQPDAGFSSQPGLSRPHHRVARRAEELDRETTTEVARDDVLVGKRLFSQAKSATVIWPLDVREFALGGRVGP